MEMIAEATHVARHEAARSGAAASASLKEQAARLARAVSSFHLSAA